MRDVATLLEALPYIREFHGRTVVIKYGGAAMVDPVLREEFARDVVLLKYVGLNPIVVHGGGPAITGYMERLGMEVEFVDGLRVSDAATVEVAKMVLVGKQNKDIVLLLGRHGQPAVGLCGDDGMLFQVRKQVRADERDLGFVGEIERVNVGVLNHIAEDYIPVIASVGADAEGQSYNVNADAAAAAVAVGAGRDQVHLPDRRGGLAVGPRGPRVAHLAEHGRRRREGAGHRPGRHAAQAPGLRPGPARAACRTRTSSTAGARTRCCWSCSPTRASGPSCGPERAAGAGGAGRGGHVRAQPGRVRPRPGHRALGRRRQRVPGLPGRHLGGADRPLPPGAGRGRDRAGRRG